MALELGTAPKPLVVRLPRRGGFRAQLRIRPGSVMAEWPAGTVITLEFAHRGQTWSWPATVDATTVSWSRTQLEQLAVPDGADAAIVCTLPGATPVEWYNGAVIR